MCTLVDTVSWRKAFSHGKVDQCRPGQQEQRGWVCKWWKQCVYFEGLGLWKQAGTSTSLSWTRKSSWRRKGDIFSNEGGRGTSHLVWRRRGRAYHSRTTMKVMNESKKDVSSFRRFRQGAHRGRVYIGGSHGKLKPKAATEGHIKEAGSIDGNGIRTKLHRFRGSPSYHATRCLHRSLTRGIRVTHHSTSGDKKLFQEELIGYSETVAPIDPFKMLLLLAERFLLERWHVHHANIFISFLNGTYMVSSMLAKIMSPTNCKTFYTDRNIPHGFGMESWRGSSKALVSSSTLRASLQSR